MDSRGFGEGKSQSCHVPQEPLVLAHPGRCCLGASTPLGVLEELSCAHKPRKDLSAELVPPRQAAGSHFMLISVGLAPLPIAAHLSPELQHALSWPSTFT